MCRIVSQGHLLCAQGFWQRHTGHAEGGWPIPTWAESARPMGKTTGGARGAGMRFQKSDVRGACRWYVPGALGPGSGNRAPRYTPKHAPRDCTEAATERTSYGPSTCRPRARRWSAGNPGNPVRLSACPGFPIDVSVSTPSGYFTHLHRTDTSPARWAPRCNPA